MRYLKSSRRMFLQGAGQTALAIPFLPSLLIGDDAKAATTVLPKYVHVNGNWGLPRGQTHPLYFHPQPPYPQPAGTNPNSVPWLQKDADTKYQSLADIIKFQGQLSLVIDKEWNRYAPQMNLVTNAHAYMGDNKFTSGISGCASSNMNGVCASDNANGPALGRVYSVDALMEAAIYRSTGMAPIPTLRVNPATANYPSEMFGTFCFNTVNGKEMRVPMAKTLAELSAILAPAVSGASGGAGGPSATTARRLKIDSVLGDYKDLMNHRRISSEDKQRLSHAADLWSNIQKSLDSSGAQLQTCTSPTFNMKETNWSLIHNAAMNAVALALACGLTRNVAYGIIQYGDAQYDPLGMDPSQPITQPYFNGLRWRSARFLYLLDRLAELKDANGQSLLESTLVVLAHNTAGGGHDMLGHTLISVGNVNNKLETGWHVEAGAAPVNRFHLTNMMAMGLTLSDIERGGKAGFGEYAPNTILAAGGNATGEKDWKTDDPEKRAYDYSKRDHFFTDAEKRKAFPYLR